MHPTPLSSGFKKLLRHIWQEQSTPSPKSVERTEAIANVNELAFEIAGACNNKWNRTNRGAKLTFLRNPILNRNHRVMTIGSCFALEIKAALRQRGFDVYPKYTEIGFDPETQKIGKLPETDDINHYDTFTIRAEFERTFSGESYKTEDFLKHTSRLRGFFGPLGREIWQDPYRRHVYANSEEKIADLSRKMDKCISDAILNADIYIITPGVTEVWRNDSNGLYINQAPNLDNNGVAPGFTFMKSTYDENYRNMHRVCSLISEKFPEKKIIMTISPVPLKATFSKRDVVIANTESKSLLRAMATEIGREFKNVIYWPSYEIALARDFFQQDGRHINPAVVEEIVDQFLNVHLQP